MSQPASRLNCATCPIRDRAVCSSCDADEMALLEQMKYYRHYEAGQVIRWAQDEMAFVASVVKGVATLSQTLQDGRTQMLGLLLPSDFIGRPGRQRSPYDVTAISDVTLCCFQRKPFEQLMITNPHVAERLLAMTLDELDAAREWMLVLGRKSAREKTASFLVILARRAIPATPTPHTGPTIVELFLTRAAMADYLGLTLETVSRQLSALKAAGVIVMDGKRRVVIPVLRHLLQQTGDDTDAGFGG